MSTPSWFNSVRVMSTPPPELPGLATPVAGLTTKPIGFGLVSFTGRPLGKFVVGEEKGMPAVLGVPTPVADVLLNGAQVDVPLVPHTSIGWTVMKQGTSPGVGYRGRVLEEMHWASALPAARQAAEANRKDHTVRRGHRFISPIVSLPSQRA